MAERVWGVMSSPAMLLCHSPWVGAAYSAVGLLSYYNQLIMDRRSIAYNSSVLAHSLDNVQRWLDVIRQIELVIEIAGARYLGRGKWILIFIVELIKYVGCLSLLRVMCVVSVFCTQPPLAGR